MGASGWSHRVAYRPDLASVVEDLRREVFAGGDYVPGSTSAAPVFEFDQPEEPPASIEEVLLAQGSEGTHSILDITGGISPAGGFRVIRPLPDEEVRMLLGTARPAPDDVEGWMDDGGYAQVCPSWSGVCVVSYEQDRPVWLHVGGWSGD